MERYSPVGANLAKMREAYIEGVGEGMMDGPLTLLEAHRKYPGPRIAAAGALAMDLEGGIRVIHDGTHGVLLNQKIRMRDKVAFPGLAEARWILAFIHHWRLRCVGAKGDVRKAHRRAKVSTKYYPKLGAKLREDEVYVNLVGSLAIASAAYWWPRLIGVAVRLLYCPLAGMPFFQLLYGGDFVWLREEGGFWGQTSLILYFYYVPGAPRRWEKFRSGRELGWVGYGLDLSACGRGLSERRVRWLAGWVGRFLAVPATKARPLEMEESASRACWAASGWDIIRPLLGPLFAWVAAAPRDALLEVPLVVLTTLRLWSHALAGRRM